MRPTPLHQQHVAAGATMVEFAGYAMPLQYRSIREEHIAVRQRAGLFDLSHMGEVRFSGATAFASVQKLVSNDVARLSDGQALYAVMCNEAGGIVDDVIVYRDSETSFMVVINAACHDKDVSWMSTHLIDGTDLVDESDTTALLALQGPQAKDVLARLVNPMVLDLKPFHHLMTPVAGSPARVARTGYTGEDGFELYVANQDAPALWEEVLAAGQTYDIAPCGLGARDTLRLEAGLRLYGQDMDETIDPYSCKLGWTVKLDKGDFIGAEALGRIDRANPPKYFVGLQLEGRAIARHGQQVLLDGAIAGEVTSGTFGFTVGCGIATAFISKKTTPTTPIAVDIRGTVAPAKEVPLPFYRRPVAVAGGP